MKTKEPTIAGLGVTYHIGSDRYPYTIVKVVSSSRIIVQADSYSRIDNNGLSEIQEYEYTPNLNAEQVTITLRKDGYWRRKGDSSRSGIFTLGKRSAYLDPSF